MKGYLKIACIMPNIFVGNPLKNVESIKEELLKANSFGAKICVFPELSLTGSTLNSLFYDKNLLNDTINALFDLINFSTEFDIIIIVSFPFLFKDSVYEVAAVIKSGKILGFVPKDHFNDDDVNKGVFSTLHDTLDEISLKDEEKKLVYSFPFGSNLYFSNDNFSFSIIFDEIINKNVNSNIYFNVTSIKETIYVDSKIRNIKQLSKKLSAIVCTSSQGPSESSDFNSYFGRSVICEDGEIIMKNDILTNKILLSDVDLDKTKIIKSENRFIYKSISFNFDNFILNPVSERLYRNFDKTPYINKKINSYNYSMHIINILSVALAKRMTAINCNNIVIGVSGGLDSTFALLVAKKTIEFLSLNNSNIFAISMPGFGTTINTNNNIDNLVKSLDLKLRVIDIKKSVNLHFNDISHDINNTNVTFENSQSRERTQILMDVANDVNGIVIGTSDMSEIALGFSTYNGDQMSMYNINGSVPKTMIRYILNVIAEENINSKNNVLLANTLKNIVHSPISPELLPTENNLVIQNTEEILGNYEIHDFVLYYYLKYGYTIEKIADLALRTFIYNNKNTNNYNEEYIKNCISVFFERFFKSQYKRVASANYPEIGLPSLNSKNGFSFPCDTNINYSNNGYNYI